MNNCQKQGNNPFAAMCEMWRNAKKNNCQSKKAEIKKPVEAMTFDEQIAHAMKLSQQETSKKTEEKKVEAKKAEKKEETMTPKMDDCDVKKPEDVNKETECNSESSDVVVIKSESEDTEDLYDDDQTETTTPKEEKAPEPKVVVVEEV